jgi:hypothetical protein
MSPGTKASFVVMGLLAFCAIAVLGPSIEAGGDSAIRTLFGATDAQAVGNRKLKADKDYAAGGPLQRAINCCSSCNSQWDFPGDRCHLRTQADTACYTRCGR